MKRHLCGCLVVVAVLTASPVAQAKRASPPQPASPATQAVQAEVIVVGKIVEIEKDTVEATRFKGASPDRKSAYNIAVLRIESSLTGAVGLTQLRVGFLPNTRGSVPLTAGMDGVFMLSPHHGGEFHVIDTDGAPLLKSDAGYAKELATVQKVAAVIDDPVTALKSKDKADRSLAALTLLTRYREPLAPDRTIERDISAEENKLLLQAVAEMPWNPDETDFTKTSRSLVWGFLDTHKLGFRPPVIKKQLPGEPPVDAYKIWDEATTAFLKANADKIRIKRLVAGK